jgi:hypothetical protein
MEKIRTLIINDEEIEVSNLTGILFRSSAKFADLAPHALREYESEYEADSFGDCGTFGAYYWKVEKNGRRYWTGKPENFRYYFEDSQGNVGEISAAEYRAAGNSYVRYCERAEQVESLEDDIREIEAEDVCANPNGLTLYVFDFAGYLVVVRADSYLDAWAQLASTRYSVKAFNTFWEDSRDIIDIEESSPYEVIELDSQDIAEYKDSRIAAIHARIERIEEGY